MSNSSPSPINGSQEDLTSEPVAEQGKIEMTPKMRWGLRLVILGGIILLLGISFILFTIVKRLGNEPAPVAHAESSQITLDLRNLVDPESELVSSQMTDQGLVLMTKNRAGNLIYRLVDKSTGTELSKTTILLK